MTGPVGDRMAALFKPDDVADDEPVATQVSGDPVGPYPPPTPRLTPDLPVAVADAIRDRLRAGDLEGAAELGRKAMNSLGIEPSVVSPGGQEESDRA